MGIIEDIGKYNQIRRYGIPKGESYQKRVRAVNAIYDEHANDGVSNRHIWRMYIHPLFGISERTFYSYLKRGI